jgi:hypothetical protein
MTLTVDAESMRSAIPQVEQMVSLLNDMARELDGVAVPAGVPAGVAAQVTSTTRSGTQSLRAQARGLNGVPADLRRRVAAAKLADAPWLNAGGWGLRALGLHFRAFSMQTLSKSNAWGLAARELRAGLKSGDTYGAGNLRAFRLNAAAAEAAGVTRGVPSGLATAADIGGKAVTGAGWALAAYSNFSDPRLSTEQKVGRTAATIATGTGVSVLAGAASGAAFGSAAGPLGTLVGLGAGAGWTVLDNKFGVSRKIGDGAAAAAGAVEDVGGDAVNTVGDGVSKAKDIGGDAVNTVGHGVSSAAGKALGVVGL